MNKDMIVSVEADVSQYEVAMKKVGEEPVKAANRAKTGFSAMTRFMDHVKRRGELLNRLKISPTIQLVDRFSAPAKKIESLIRKMANSTVTIAFKARDMTGRVIEKITSPLTLIGAGAGAAGLFGYPLKLAGQMEQAFIGMEFFLKSKDRADRFMEELFIFAAKTPFELPQLREMSVQLLGARMATDQVLRTLRAFGDAASMTGAGINGMKMALLGFRQIAAIGKLNMEELRQVTENLLIPLDQIVKELGLPKEALEDLGNMGIESARAIEAILRVLERDYVGGMAKQSRSFFGLLSTIKDYINLKLFYPWGEGLREVLVPQMQNMVDWLDNGGKAAKDLDKSFAGWASVDDSVFRLNRAINEGVIGWGKLADKTAFAENKLDRIQNRLRRMGRETATFVSERIKSLVYWIDKLNKDEKFQQLSFGGKILFAFDDLMKKFKSWLDSGGQEQLNSITATMADIFTSGLKASAPKIADAAITIGKAIGEAILSGFNESLQSSFLGSIIIGALGGAGAGSLIGGVGALPGAIAGAGAGAITYGVTNVANSARENAEKSTDISFFHTPGMYASGGILNRPHLGLVAEAGPEAIIPLSSRMRSRALDLWQKTGRYLGVRPYETGGLIGSLASTGGSASQGVSIYTGDTHVHISDYNELDEDALALRIGRKIVHSVRKALENRV